MHGTDDWDDWDGWDDEPAPASGRTWVVVVAVLLLIPFVAGTAAGGLHALGPALPAIGGVVVFFVAVAAVYLLVRRMLRERIEGPPRSTGGSAWSDRR